MTPAKVTEVLATYEGILRSDWTTFPLRNSASTDLGARLDHLDWMCEQAATFVDTGRMEKAFRWLGFIQGAFWALGIRSIEESKRDNIADQAAFDKERV